MIRILVDRGAPDVELCIRAALGERPPAESWVVSAVRLSSGWVVTFPVSPGDRLTDFSWSGPTHRVRDAVKAALCGAGYAAAEAPRRNVHPPSGTL